MLSPQSVRRGDCVSRGAQQGPNQANPEGVSGYQSGSWSKVTGSSPEAQGVSHYLREAQGNYILDGANDTHFLGTDLIVSQKGRNGPEKQKFLCAQHRRKRWVIDSEESCAAEMIRFTKCIFCVFANRDEHSSGKLQAALIKEMDNLRRSIEQTLCTLEGEIEDRANSSEASHSREGDAATEVLRQELGSLPTHRRDVHMKFF